MRRPQYTRQLVLFLVSAVLPALVLVGLAVYLIRQDSELSVRRAADERARAIDRVHRELSARLSEITLQELNRRLRVESGAVPDAPADPAVVFVAPLEGLPEAVESRRTPPAGSEAERLWQRQTSQQLDALVPEIANVKEQIEAAALSNGFAWVAYGLEPWLITITPPEPEMSSIVVVVSSHQVTPRGTILVAGTTPTSTSLGAPFVNASLEWPPGPYAPRGPRESAPFFIAGLLLILGIVLFSGYLLLRDVNREVRLAELRTHFVANVSHEIKTPLTAIRLYADKMAMASSLDERTRAGYIAIIANESERLSRLVDNVLEFSRIETGAKTYRIAPASLNDVVHSATRAIDYMLVQRGFNLKVTVEPDVPPIRMDAGSIEQALLNLLINAVKYSGDSREIDVRVAYSNKEAVIAVSDKGIGIDPAEQVRIFEKFYRVESTPAGHVAGTGLGLTLAQHIVAAHGGRIAVRSAPGRGSTFSIHIPVEAV